MSKNPPKIKSIPDSQKPRQKAKWTIIILIAAESDLQEEFKEVYDQMARVGSNPGEVNFVVIFDGLNLPGSSQGKVKVYYVTRNSFFQDVSDHKRNEKGIPSLDDLSNTKNLKSILQKVKERFPAKFYGFIYKGHGGPNPDISNASFIRKTTFRAFAKGRFESDSQVIKKVLDSLPKLKLPKKNGKNQRRRNRELEDPHVISLHDPTVRGPRQPSSANEEVPLMVLFRSSKGGSRELSYSSLGEVLKKVFSTEKKKFGLEFVCLDACWGQLIENGMAFREVTKYLVASADEMAVMGIGYEGFCNFLVNRPDVFPDELADLIVSEYFQTEYNDYLSNVEFNHMGVSLTCVETTYLHCIIKLMCELSEYLTHKIDTHFYIIHLARLQCKAYTYELTESDYSIYNIDLIWFLENLQHYNRINDTPIDVWLDSKLSEILRLLSLYYIKSYLANNYEVRKPGERSNGNGMHQAEARKAKKKQKKIQISKKQKEIQAMKNMLGVHPIVGGKGIGIIFPSSIEQLNDSLYKIGKSQEWLDENWNWGSFLAAYVEKKHSILKRGKNEPVLIDELSATEEVYAYEKYLDKYKKLANWIGNGNENGYGNGNGKYTLDKKLLCALVGIPLNIEHKWVENKKLSRELIDALRKRSLRKRSRRKKSITSSGS